MLQGRDRRLLQLSNHLSQLVCHRESPCVEDARDSASKRPDRQEILKMPSSLTVEETRPLFSIADLAERWRCSRASVYNRIRGEKVVDFAAAGHKGHKLVPLEVVLKIERANLRVYR